MNDTDISGYRYPNASPSHAHGYLLPAVKKILQQIDPVKGGKRVFELGCGNGSVAHELTRSGWDVTGVDPSIEGITQAQSMYPDLRLHQGSAYDDLASQYGKYSVVLSLEVVEHVYAPRDYARTVHDLLERGG